MWWMSFLLLDNLFQLGRHVRNLFPQNLHLTTRTATRDNIDFTESFSLVRKILAKMTAAALFSFNRSASDRFRDRQEIRQIQRRVPTCVVFAIAVDNHLASPFLQGSDFVKREQHFSFCAHNTDQFLHLFLEVVLHSIWAFASGVSRRPSFERLERPTSSAVDLIDVDLAEPVLFRELRGKPARAFAEHQEIRERVSTKPVRTMKTCRAF